MDTTIEFPNPITATPPEESDAHTPHSSAFWDDFEAFYAKHGKLVEQCSKADMKAILAENKASAEIWIGNYTETVKVVLSGLATLGKIHPVISVAVEAFGLVVSLDIARRENDKKVILIRVAMQNMMCAMFQLRHLRDPNAQAASARTDLQHLVERIKEDINKCSGDLSGYTTQKTFTRIINSKIYEERFKEHLESFAQNHAALHLAITTYTAGGVDRANLQLSLLAAQNGHTHAKLDSIDAKVDIFQQLFCSPKEWEALKFIAKHGVKACVEQDELLQKLLALAGEDLIDNEKGSKADLLTRRMAAARVEAKKDFGAILEENRERFDKILMLQKINHEQVFERLNMTDKHQQTATSKLDKLLYIINPDVRLTDPELQRVWKLMGYKTIAKAKNFVLTFRDHYQHALEIPATPILPDSGGLPTLLINQPTSRNNNLTVSTTDNALGASATEDPNAWLLEYLDVAHVRPIVEAMDIDGSGFISVEELNLFARSRPKDWSLLQWMVYWAAGWHLNIVSYREKIYDILVQMHEAVPALHPANSVLVAGYLDSNPIQCVEGLLRFTKEVQDRSTSQLHELATSYAVIEEANIKSKLDAASYILGSEADAVLVGGAGRPESWLYPLLFLVLQRHLAIINLAKSRILHADEMATHQSTIYSIITVLDQRKDVLQAIFSQLSQSVESRFETFAWGMFYASYKYDTEIVAAKNTLFSQARTRRSTQDLIFEIPGHMSRLAQENDVSILAHGEGAPFEFDDTHIPSLPASGTEQNGHPLNGYWTCVSYNQASEVQGRFHYNLLVNADGAISGTRESWAGLSSVSGTVDVSLDGSPMSLHMDYVLNDSHVYIDGVYDPVRDIIDARLDHETPVSQSISIPDIEGNPSEEPEQAKDELPQGSSSEDQADVGQPQALMVDGDVPEYAEHTPNQPTDDTQGVPDVPIDPTALQMDPTPTADDIGEASEIQPSGDLADTNGDNQDLPEKITLHMTRTHESVVNFRRYLESEIPTSPDPSPSAARRRWFFAIDATRRLVRTQRMSWQYVKGKFAERRQYLDLVLREKKGLITDNDLERLTQLTKDLPPSQTRLYESLATFLFDRLYHFKIGHVSCDGCYDSIICQRYRCITCVNNTFGNQIDICTDNAACLTASLTNERENFVHDPSHSLLRQTNYIYSSELPSLISQCRTLSESIKKRFRSLDEERKVAKKNARAKRNAKNLERTPQVQETSAQILCAYCDKEVSLPCWVCVACDSETIICLDCENPNAEVKDVSGNMHWRDHHLLRINDSKEVESGEINNARLQQELTKIASDVHTLEGKVTAHLKTATQLIKGSGEPVAEAFGDLESEYGLLSDFSGPIFVAAPITPGPADDAAKEPNHDSTQNLKVDSTSASAVPPGIDHADTMSSVHLTAVSNEIPGGPSVEAQQTTLGEELSALQIRVASLDTRISGLETALSATASSTDSRLSRVESQLGEVLTLLSQLLAR